MKTQNKSLLIHHDSRTDTTESMVVEEKDIFKKTKEFLKKIAKNKNAEVKVYYPLGIVLKTTDGTKEYAYAIAYERDRFVIVVPNGTHESAKLYGNWNEALLYVQKVIKGESSKPIKKQIVLTQYRIESK